MIVSHYQHKDCPVEPGVEWQEIWDCACNGECPACETKDIEPFAWEDEDEPDWEIHLIHAEEERRNFPEVP